MRLHKLITGTGAVLGMMAVSLLRRKAAYSLRGKTVLVPGGSRGFGLLLARAFASRGARVAILARDADELARAVQQLQTITSEIIAIQADVRVRPDAEDADRQVRQSFGSLNILVNNAGIITVGSLEMATADDYRDSIEIHFWGAFFTSMAVLPEMRRRGEGRIVNIAFIGGKISVPHLFALLCGKVCSYRIFGRASIRVNERQYQGHNRMSRSHADRQPPECIIQWEL
jgi:NAD(P)-dependent dehydrogenase (short-subunit alcohol dehydrogenase family)